MRAFFVTGTDTDVGKTTVGCALLRAVVDRGQRGQGIKPIESGCRREGELLIADDAAALARAGRHKPIVFETYEAPLAPKAAALADGTTELDVSQCVSQVQAQLKLAEAEVGLALVEGAGGLLVPIGSNLLIADMAKALELPLLIVGRDGLGTINHTAMTIRTAHHYQLDVAGFCFSATANVDELRADANAEAVTAITGAQYLGRLPRLETESANDGAAILAELLKQS